MADGVAGGLVYLRVQAVDHDATRVLADAMLATQFGGGVLAREKNGQFVPERATFRVLLTASEVPSELVGASWRGRVVIHGDWEAPGWRFLRSALALLWREAGF